MSARAIIGACIAALGFAAAAVAGDKAGSSGAGRNVMEHLFDAELRHTGKVKLEPRGPKEGRLVGGGEGTALGPRIKGKLRWSLYENHAPGGCTMQLPGEIETEDGAKIHFEGQGHAIVPDKDTPSRWKVAGAFRLEAKDARYEWLNGVLALWEGDFDMSTGKARYRLYISR